MGFRFNRRVSILPGVRVNFGKTGASLSIGRRGSWLTFGKRGTQATVGLPGTGLSYTTKLNSSKPAARQSPRPPIPTWVWVSGVLFFAWVMGNLRHHPSELPVTSLSPSSDATVLSTIPNAAISSTTPIVKAKKRHGAVQKSAPSSSMDDVSAPPPTADAPPVNTTNANQSTQVSQEALQRKAALVDEQRVQAEPAAASTAPLQQPASPQVFARCLAYLRSTGETESSPGEFSRVCANEQQ
jgi:hypothetical protein